jgi:hypothetical protein
VNGATFDANLDGKRLTSQLEKVKAAMKGGAWWTLAKLAQTVEGSEAGVSARLRDLRRPENGGHTVKRERVKGGLWRYRLEMQSELNLEKQAV